MSSPSPAGPLSDHGPGSFPRRADGSRGAAPRDRSRGVHSPPWAPARLTLRPARGIRAARRDGPWPSRSATVLLLGALAPAALADDESGPACCRGRCCCSGARPSDGVCFRAACHCGGDRRAFLPAVGLPEGVLTRAPCSRPRARAGAPLPGRARALARPVPHPPPDSTPRSRPPSDRSGPPRTGRVKGVERNAERDGRSPARPLRPRGSRAIVAPRRPDAPRMRRLAMAASVVMACAPSATAGTGSGRVSGSVSGPDGARLPGVRVTLTSARSGTVARVSTGGLGTWRSPDVPAGAYDVSASLPGFAAATRAASSSPRPARRWWTSSCRSPR